MRPRKLDIPDRHKPAAYAVYFCKGRDRQVIGYGRREKGAIQIILRPGVILSWRDMAKNSLQLVPVDLDFQKLD
jgi:hypothetical protein